MSYLLVISTAPSKRVAQKLAKLLVQKKLAACVTLQSPVESIYRWKGKLASSREVVLLIKTRKTLYKKLERALIKHHPYDVPEVIAVPIQKGSLDYLKWLSRETQ